MYTIIKLPNNKQSEKTGCLKCDHSNGGMANNRCVRNPLRNVPEVNR